MKEFEKWWNNEMPKNTKYESYYHKCLLEDGWKAALNWILDEAYPTESINIGMVWCVNIKDIKKELEE